MIQIAVCDDEPVLLDGVVSRLSNYMESKNLPCQISRFASGRTLLESDRDFDIFFLDIQMEPPDGMETARRLREQNCRSLLIFLTVLKDNVFDSFEVQAFDYLIKPLEEQRFQHTMNRAVKFLEQRAEKSILVQRGSDCHIIPFSDIVYCEVLGRKVYLHRIGGEIIDYYEKLEDLEKRLDNRFFKCHRSYLVNLDYVQGCSEGLVELPNNSKIPVSRLREQELTQALLIHMKERRR